MNFFKELMRIADNVAADDAAILREAAVRLAPRVKPLSQTLHKIPEWGYLYFEIHGAYDAYWADLT